MLRIYSGRQWTFHLDSPAQGVFIPSKCWHTMQYSHNSVQLVLASTLYDADDYIRSYEEFREIQRAHLAGL